MASRRKSTKPPVLRRLELSGLGHGRSETLRDSETYELLSFEGVDATGRDLADTGFSECELLRWTADRLKIQGAGFSETKIGHLTAPVVDAEQSTLRDVRIEHSRLGSASFSDVEAASVEFSHSKLDWLNMRGSRLRDVIFRNCVFEEIDLMGANLQRVAFEDCRASTINFERSTLRDVDLRGLEMDRVIGIDALRGATITAWQLNSLAEALASHHGIILEE